MKLAAICDRNTRKDFVDLHVLIRRHAPLGELVAFFFQKFPGASSVHLLRSLTYFAEADQGPMPRMFERVTWARIKREITEAASNIEIVD